jgi:FKBP-type peptidyl-prolyl cis-trans isomerase SlyD
MKIDKNKVVSFTFIMKDELGAVLDGSFQEEVVYLHGYHHILPLLEQGLAGHQQQETVKLTIPPEKGYGKREEALIKSVPRNQFAKEDSLKVGAKVYSPEHQDFVMTIVDIQPESILLDANHPLAGKTLLFEIHIVGVRDATEEEIAKQQVLVKS